MPTQTYNKLVRDKIPGIIRANGEQPVVRQLVQAEFVIALKQKLAEEAQEVVTAAQNQIVAEIGDVLDVVTALQQELGIADAEVAAARMAAMARKGGFNHRYFLETVTKN